ncbi:type II toxin-antitoxin system VapC family toxin [Aurantimonas sp. C2-6-R+9]|uniref:type II toxin-antitoxin system VapC family toxin n=1 Tax=unclassified Aurantimonas TaxID=2638230 RepID=UPI002E16DDB5|nr:MULTISPECIES: type II toxin-antitoxin system VapC family toxin [unclassified Aurantimonas]MEC5292309.1 type II toxin-antitoxin system VapC family toxin [Aurantimonas sp. C2-3-R2]MEC5323332.1 type II toxin-antitoxin system VapC family toxin [Aurantimonas sp. A3-2-R12]MEC5382586.1 type II toxin-antitoxin system VapC family toxin [Aurantimonas sp. C2-6-R+9]MEC5413394.1 type II toxin-antitoxin system VapC family toxin [Aurantimonas sp. C2-4-R8]
MYLLDTMVVSELAKTPPHDAVLAWLARNADSKQFLSVMTFGELERGIASLRRRNRNRADRLSIWFAGLSEEFVDRTLPVTYPIARIWGQLSIHSHSHAADLLIAATALEHDLIIVTRNIRHFAPTGAKLFNPYEV